MKSPRDKYMNDPEYYNLVNVMESFIERAHYTPSELREAAILACINYEMKHIRESVIDPKVFEALNILDKFTSQKNGR